MRARVQVDFEKKRIRFHERENEDLQEFYAVEAVDTAESIFQVLQSDATYMQILDEAGRE